jgi:hypothetical protein
VPASGDSEDDCGEQMECRLTGETEVLGENLSITKSHMPRSGFKTLIYFEFVENAYDYDLRTFTSVYGIEDCNKHHRLWSEVQTTVTMKSLSSGT